jgi:hypothetical protein
MHACSNTHGTERFRGVVEESCLCLYVCIYVFTCVQIYTHMHHKKEVTLPGVSSSLHMYACMCVCMNVCTDMDTYAPKQEVTLPGVSSNYWVNNPGSFERLPWISSVLGIPQNVSTIPGRVLWTKHTCMCVKHVNVCILGATSSFHGSSTRCACTTTHASWSVPCVQWFRQMTMV